MTRTHLFVAVVVLAQCLSESALLGDTTIITAQGSTQKQKSVPQQRVDGSSIVIAEVANAVYKRPTADDLRAIATIPVEAWGEPVNGLRVAIVLRSPPLDKNALLNYDIVAENVSDRDIRFAATVGNRWLGFCKIELIDADGKQVPPQQGILEKWRPQLLRFLLKPRERVLISPWNTQLVRVQKKGELIAERRGHHGHPFFRVTPGRYSVSATIELGPSMESRDPATGTRTVLSPARGEWSGKLKTGTVAVALFTGDGRGPSAKSVSEQKTGRIEGRAFELPEIQLSNEQKRTLAQAGVKVEDIPPVRVRSIKLNLRGRGQVDGEAAVGEDGTFVFEDAPTGPVELSPSFRLGDFDMTLAELNVPTTVRAGETTQVAFFGKGRPIMGKVVLPQNIKPENVRIGVKLVAPPFRQTSKPDGKFHLGFDWRIYGQVAKKHQPAELDKDGQFRIDGVREGVYRITAEVIDGSARLDLRFDTTVKAGDPYVQYGRFTVPLMAGGESDTPHHLGTLQFKLPAQN